jgi:hypothetical protein
MPYDVEDIPKKESSERPLYDAGQKSPVKRIFVPQYPGKRDGKTEI